MCKQCRLLFSETGNPPHLPAPGPVMFPLCGQMDNHLTLCWTSRYPDSISQDTVTVLCICLPATNQCCE